MVSVLTKIRGHNCNHLNFNFNLSFISILFEFQTCAFSKSITSRRQQRAKEDVSFYTAAQHSLSQLAPPSSENQHIRNALDKCNSNEQVMSIIRDCSQCGDASVFTKAINVIRDLNRGQLRNNKTALQCIFQVWNIMNQDSEPDAVRYNILLKTLVMLNEHNRVKPKFDEMLQQGITPNLITLDILLHSLRKSGDIKQAIAYWNIIIHEFAVSPDAICYKSFLSVCAKARDSETAETWFTQCAYQSDPELCWKMLDVYANTGDMNKMQSMRKYMENNDIEFDYKIFNSMISGYVFAGNPQMAVGIAHQAMTDKKYNFVTIKHCLHAYIKLIEQETDWHQREEYLRHIENTVTGYFRECGDIGKEFMRSAEFADRMFDAYFNTYRDTFGSRTFAELRGKYRIQYWEDSGDFKIPTLCLYLYSVQQSEFLLRYVMEKELDSVRDTGFNIIIAADKSVSRWRTVATFDDVVKMLESFDPPIIVHRNDKDRHLLHVTKEQTMKYQLQCELSDDEPLFS